VRFAEALAFLVGRWEDGPVVYRVLLVVFGGVALALVALWIAAAIDGQDMPSDAADAEAAALRWVRIGVAQRPRRDGGEWEVDVVRPDGSMVQVRLGRSLELRDLDEELGPAGTPAHDEMQGEPRARAVRTAFAEIGPGQVVSVERDSIRDIEVSIRLSDDRQVQVELDDMFRVVEVTREHPSDE
jgi:hypothetical protein